MYYCSHQCVWPRISPQEIIPIVAIIFPCTVDVFPPLYGNPKWGAFVEKLLGFSMSCNSQRILFFIDEFQGACPICSSKCGLLICASVKRVCECVYVCVKSPEVINNELFWWSRRSCFILTLKTEYSSSVCSGEACAVSSDISEQSIHVPGLWSSNDEPSGKGFCQREFRCISDWYFHLQDNDEIHRVSPRQRSIS